MKNITQKILILTLVSTFLFSCSNDDSEEMNLAQKSNDISVVSQECVTYVLSIF